MAGSSAVAETSGSLRTSHTKELSFRGPQSFVTTHVGSGEKKESFMVPKSLISYPSQFFKAAFNSNFEQGDSQEMTLEDVDNEIFAMLVGILVYWEISATIILDKLGAPLHLHAKNGSKDLVLAMKELAEYVGLSESSEKWLGQYCIRSLVTLCQPEQTATTRSKEARDNIKTIMGNSVAGAVVLALLKFDPATSREWKAKDFLVDENF